MGGEKSEFHFVGVVQRAEKREVKTAAGPKPKYDVFAVGTGPDSNVTNPRRVALWRWKKAENVDVDYWHLVETEIAKAVGLAPGDPIPLRFSGMKTARDEGGFFYDGNKVEIYDPAVHGTTSSNGGSSNGGAGPAGGRSQGMEPAPADPTRVTVADAMTAITALLPRLPKEKKLEDGSTGPLSPAEQSTWLYERSLSLLRVARRAAIDASAEPLPVPPRPGEERS